MWVENRDNWSIYIEWCLGSLGVKTRKSSQERKYNCAWKICSACSLADIPVPSDFITYQDLEQFQSFLTLPLCSGFFCNLVLLSDLIISSLLLIFYYLTSCRYPISVICCYFSVQATNEVHGAGPGLAKWSAFGRVICWAGSSSKLSGLGINFLNDSWNQWVNGKLPCSVVNRNIFAHKFGGQERRGGTATDIPPISTHQEKKEASDNARRHRLAVHAQSPSVADLFWVLLKAVQRCR